MHILQQIMNLILNYQNIMDDRTMQKWVWFLSLRMPEMMHYAAILWPSYSQILPWQYHMTLVHRLPDKFCYIRIITCRHAGLLFTTSHWVLACLSLTSEDYPLAFLIIPSKLQASTILPYIETLTSFSATNEQYHCFQNSEKGWD